MADEIGTAQGQPEVTRPRTRLTERGAEIFEELAHRADEIAQSAEYSADVHERLPPHLLSPPDHVKRERLLAAAERAAAEAYRAHRVPSDEVRTAIVEAGSASKSDPGGGPSGSQRETESSPDA